MIWTDWTDSMGNFFFFPPPPPKCRCADSEKTIATSGHRISSCGPFSAQGRLRLRLDAIHVDGDTSEEALGGYREAKGRSYIVIIIVVQGQEDEKEER